MKITKQIMLDVCEIFLNQTQDYDVIADQMGITVTDVANILNAKTADELENK